MLALGCGLDEREPSSTCHRYDADGCHQGGRFFNPARCVYWPASATSHDPAELTGAERSLRCVSLLVSISRAFPEQISIASCWDVDDTETHLPLLKIILYAICLSIYPRSIRLLMIGLSPSVASQCKQSLPPESSMCGSRASAGAKYSKGLPAVYACMRRCSVIFLPEEPCVQCPRRCSVISF